MLGCMISYEQHRQKDLSKAFQGFGGFPKTLKTLKNLLSRLNEKIPLTQQPPEDSQLDQEGPDPIL